MDSKRRPAPFMSLHLSKTGAFFLTLCATFWVFLQSRNFYGFSISTENHIDAAPDFSHLAEHCADASPISRTEFYQRQKSLARVLRSLNASAYIAEPGATAQFFGNISSSQWHLSERPLLLIVTPRLLNEEDVAAQITVLTPSFEATRAKLLHIPSASHIAFAEWPEDANPYEVAMSALPPPVEGHATIFVDGAIRHFIVDGLTEAAPKYKVSSAPMEIRYLRERKSSAEIELMKCANEVTVLAIRAVRDQMYIGIRESQVRHMMESALSAAGLQGGFALVLFGENAALPHGSGTDRVLSKHDFILIDTGGTLYGYHSDVTRTFALRYSIIPPESHRIWDYVYEAQNVAADTARSGAVTSKVDEMARAYLGLVGYGQYFTHRLGHGIGLEEHEQPYLRGGSRDIIQTGHTFSNEPGIYLEGVVGVRLEDCFYIDDAGLPIFLTDGVGGQSQDPWRP